MKHKRVLATKIARRIIDKYDINVFTNHLAETIMDEMIKFEDSPKP